MVSIVDVYVCWTGFDDDLCDVEEYVRGPTVG